MRLKVCITKSVLAALLLAPALALAQHMGMHGTEPIENNTFLNCTEVLTGLAAAVVAFQAALAYREGTLGKGMTWVAVGMVIMSVGHFVLVIKRFIGFDPFGFLGHTGSFIAFSLAVFASFGASAAGFWMMRKAAMGERAPGVLPSPSAR